jgi:hypothetical protein
MSAPPGRRRGREGDQDEGEGVARDQRTVAAAQIQSADRAVSDAQGESKAGPSAADAQPPPPADAGVQPLPEHFRRRPDRLPRFSSPLDGLAVVELQLCLQFLDSDSRLKAARCSGLLFNAASAPFAWRAVPPFVVEVRSATDVERIQTSLLRFAPVQLRCVRMEPLQCMLTVPHLFGLELLQSPSAVTAADLSRLLQHPSLARLQTLRLDDDSCRLLTVDTVRLIARLPQLRALGMTVPPVVSSADLLRPLPGAPALTDLSVTFADWALADGALMGAVGECAGLRRLRLGHLMFPSGAFLALCSSPSMRRLQHLELAHCHTPSQWFFDALPSGAAQCGDACSSLEQLQSLTLQQVNCISSLLPRLRRAPALRLLSFRCEPDLHAIESTDSSLPSRDVLSALLAAAPRLEVRLLLPATLDCWIQLRQSDDAEHRDVFEQQWWEMQRMGAELERVTIVNWEPPSA